MKYLLLSIMLISCGSLAALLPEDAQKIAHMKSELHRCEAQVKRLNKQIAALRENIARESSAASFREAHNRQTNRGTVAI